MAALPGTFIKIHFSVLSTSTSTNKRDPWHALIFHVTAVVFNFRQTVFVGLRTVRGLRDVRSLARHQRGSGSLAGKALDKSTSRETRETWELNLEQKLTDSSPIHNARSLNVTGDLFLQYYFNPPTSQGQSPPIWNQSQTKMTKAKRSSHDLRSALAEVSLTLYLFIPGPFGQGRSTIRSPNGLSASLWPLKAPLKSSCQMVPLSERQNAAMGAVE